MKTHFRFAVLLTLAAAVAAAGDAQEAAPPSAGFLDTVAVELVNVEVFVTDRRGEPVPDLAREDFRVLEDGRPVEVTHFVPVGDAGAAEAAPAASGASAAAPKPTAAEPAHVLVFLDNYHVGPASRARVLEQVWLTLERVLHPGDRVMLASYGGSIEVALPFTADHDELLNALRAEMGRGLSALQLQAGLEDQRALELIRDLQRSAVGETQSPGVDGACVDLGGAAEAVAQQSFHRVQQTIGALTSFVNSLAGIPGRKTLLHVSDGIPLVAGGQAWSYAIELCDGTGAAQGVPYAVDVTMLGDVQRHRWDPLAARVQMSSFDTTEDWQRLAAHANAHQVSFYTLQASGPQEYAQGAASGVRTSLATAQLGVRNVQDSLALIAAETGGRALLNTNDFTGGVEAMVADARSHYLLAFEPSKPGDGRAHRIQVRVERPGVEARHRKSYRAKSPQEQTADGVLSALIHGETDNPLGARLAVVRREKDERGAGKVRLQVRLPLNNLTLLPEEASRRGMFTVFLAAEDEAGNRTPVRHAPVPVVVPAGGAEEDFVYEVDMPLAPGRNQVALALRDEIGGTTSFLRQSVEVKR